jgi:hypothetical protein
VVSAARASDSTMGRSAMTHSRCVARRRPLARRARAGAGGLAPQSLPRPRAVPLFLPPVILPLRPQPRLACPDHSPSHGLPPAIAYSSPGPMRTGCELSGPLDPDPDPGLALPGPAWPNPGPSRLPLYSQETIAIVTECRAISSQAEPARRCIGDGSHRDGQATAAFLGQSRRQSPSI